MAWVRTVTSRGRKYRQLVESYRDEEGKVQRRVLKHLGPAEKRVRVTPEYLYLMTDASGLYKIGMANDVQKRILDFRCMNPTIKLVDVIHIGPQVKSVEKALLDKYAPYCVTGEWFRLPTDYLDSWSDLSTTRLF